MVRGDPDAHSQLRPRTSLLTHTPLSTPAAERLISEAEADKLPSDMDEELQALLSDKEAMMTALTTSSESRVSRILKREATLKAREEARCNGAVKGARMAEMQRNRARILEIKGIAAACTARAQKEVPEAVVDEEEHQQ